jgi:hypothetical protein
MLDELLDYVLELYDMHEIPRADVCGDPWGIWLPPVSDGEELVSILGEELEEMRFGKVGDGFRLCGEGGCVRVAAEGVIGRIEEVTLNAGPQIGDSAGARCANNSPKSPYASSLRKELAPRAHYIGSIDEEGRPRLAK